MKKTLNTIWAIVRVGGWAPLLVFIAYLLLTRAIHAFQIWPSLDIPMHFSGGMAVAFFISRCFQTLPRESVGRSRVAVLELLLIGSLTISVAVFWEFAEFTADQLFGSNLQVSLANTMQDLAMGISGAIVIILIRSRQLRVGAGELRAIAVEWVRGQVI
jgi:hypothetical protein